MLTLKYSASVFVMNYFHSENPESCLLFTMFVCLRLFFVFCSFCFVSIFPLCEVVKKTISNNQRKRKSYKKNYVVKLYCAERNTVSSFWRPEERRTQTSQLFSRTPLNETKTALTTIKIFNVFFPINFNCGLCKFVHYFLSFSQKIKTKIKKENRRVSKYTFTKIVYCKTKNFLDIERFREHHNVGTRLFMLVVGKMFIKTLLLTISSILDFLASMGHWPRRR